MADHLRAGLRCEAMAMKTDFEDSKDISSPFVDEVANPGAAFLGNVMRTIKDKVGDVLRAGSEAHQRGVDAKRDRKQTRDIRRRNGIRY